jgi:hypothetical protein
MHIIQILVHTKHSLVIVNQKSRKGQMSFQNLTLKIMAYLLKLFFQLKIVRKINQTENIQLEKRVKLRDRI